MEKLYVDAQVFPNQVQETLMAFGLAREKEEEEDIEEAFGRFGAT